MVAAGICVNTRGGAYKHGKARLLQDKAMVAHKYFELEENLLVGQQISILSLAKACAMNRNFPKRVVGDIESGQLTDPRTKVQGHMHGKGALALLDGNGFYLLHLWTLKK